MRRLALWSAVLTLIVVAPVHAQSDDDHGFSPIEMPPMINADNVWHIRGDDGGIVHVFADINSAEAAAHRGGNATQGPGGLEHGLAETSAPINGYSVFNASYGSVPGQLNDHGGSVISNAAFKPIFYNGATASALQSGIDGFVNNFSNSDPGMKVITQYSKSGNAISASLTHSSDFVDSKTAPSTISDSQIRSYLTGLFNAGRFTASSSVIYGVYLPQGTTSTNGTARSCTNYCGYHSSFTYSGKTIKYAVFPYLTCSGCSLSGKTVVNMETIVTSHEIREAITDPVNAWWESTSGYEADDKCAWHHLYQQPGGAWVQPEYSNALAGWPRGCVTP